MAFAQRSERGVELGLGSWIPSFLPRAHCLPQVRHDPGRGLGIKQQASELEVLAQTNAGPGDQTKGGH